MKNASRVLDNSGNGRALNLDQKPRENKSKHAKFILSVRVYEKILSFFSSKICNGSPDFIHQNPSKH